MLLVAVVVGSGCAVVVPPVAQEANERCAVLIASGQLDEADAACDLSLEYQPQYWDALHNKGLIAMQRGNRRTAREFFIKAIRSNQHMKSSLNSLGALETEDGAFDSAEGRFRQALTIDPRYLEARRNLGAVLLKRSKWSDAASEFRKLILTHPEFVEAHVGLAAALLPQKQFEEAAQVLDRATTLDVNSDAAWQLKGELFQSLGRLEDAKDAFERCLLANEQNVPCRRALTSR